MRNLIPEHEGVDSLITTNNNDATAHEYTSVKYIDGRFGNIKIDLAKMIILPQGLLGMPGITRFCLATFPDPKYGNFKILQSVDDETLAFIVLPLGGVKEASNLIDQADLEQARDAIGIADENLLILLITSVYHLPKTLNAQDTAQEARISVNVRAPLMIDASYCVGMQYVFHNEKYLVQHIIN